jgi:peptide/nickel transport system permease protein
MRSSVIKAAGAVCAALLALTLLVFGIVYGAAAGPAQPSTPQRSLASRYDTFLRGLVLHGSLGRSTLTHASVATGITSHLAPTLELLVVALAFILLIGRGLTLAQLRAHSAPRPLHALAELLQTPEFLLGAALALYSCFAAGLLSAGGQLAPNAAAVPHHTGAAALDALLSGDSAAIGTALAHLWPPALTLALLACAAHSLIDRSSANSTPATAPAIEFARARGLTARRLADYAARLGAHDAVARYGAATAAVLTFDVVVERAYSWNGLGAWFIARAQAMDLADIAGVLVVLCTAAAAIHLIATALEGARERRLIARG